VSVYQPVMECIAGNGFRLEVLPAAPVALCATGFVNFWRDEQKGSKIQLPLLLVVPKAAAGFAVIFFP
jgi:hypothetical protein